MLRIHHQKEQHSLLFLINMGLQGTHTGHGTYGDIFCLPLVLSCLSKLNTKLIKGTISQNRNKQKTNPWLCVLPRERHTRETKSFLLVQNGKFKVSQLYHESHFCMTSKVNMDRANREGPQIP